MSTLQEMGLAPDSGISPEEQKEILKEIEQVATQNRTCSLCPIECSFFIFHLRTAEPV